MKKFRYIALLLSLIFVLVACSKSPKGEFKARLESLQSLTKSAYHYKIKVNDLKLGNQSVSSMDMKQLVGKTIEADISQDSKNNLVNLSVNLSAIDSKFSDFQMVYKDDKAYMTVQPFLIMNGVDAKEAKGKFVDVAEMSGEKMPSLKDAKSKKELDLSWLDKIDEKHFKKDGDNVSVTLSMNQLLKVYQSVLKQMADSDDSAEEFKTYLNLAKASLSDKSKAVLTLDKDGNLKTSLSMIYAKGMDSLVKSVDLVVDAKKVAYKAPSLPSSSDIVSSKALEELIMGEQKLSDEDFNSMYEEMKAQGDQISKEAIETFLAETKPYLTEEQIKKIEALAQEAKG